MFSFLNPGPTIPRGIPANESEFAVRLGAMNAKDVIESQFDKFERETRRPCRKDVEVRRAVDEFVAGYAIGIALSTAQNNGGSGVLSTLVMDEVGKQLVSTLPGIDLAKSVKAQRERFKCGFLIGSVEGSRAGKHEALEYLLQVTSHHQLAPRVYFQQWAANSLGLTWDEMNFVGRAARDIASDTGNPNARDG